MDIPHKTHYTTPPHTRAKLDGLRAVASNWKDREEIKRIETSFLAEDVAEFDPEFDRKVRAHVALLKGKT